MSEPTLYVTVKCPACHKGENNPTCEECQRIGHRVTLYYQVGETVCFAVKDIIATIDRFTAATSVPVDANGGE